MNQNLSEEKKDIKPERPDLSSNRRARKTGGGGFLFSSLVLILNSIGLIILFLWFFNTSGNQQQAGQNFVERISVLEERLAQKDQQINILSEEVEADLKFVNKEIRKLWDLSNKRNRKNISENLNSIENLNEKIESIDKKDEVLSAQQRALTLELARIKNIQDNINSQLDNFDESAPNETASDKLADIQESIDSFNAYRVQVNQSLLNLREQLNNLELALSQAENE
jgi:uncharacterized coiled-coil protein SlyX|tara:strand:- start:734 stop:1411 length:678 start_codon:yes stop_codon:yes gene_type:complete